MSATTETDSAAAAEARKQEAELAAAAGCNSDDGVARELERLKLTQKPRRVAGGSKKKKKEKRPRRPWPGPAKQSTFVFLFQGDTVYAVRNRADELGAPGGKRDPGDRGIWDAACREFKEETGAQIPGGTYAYFEWGTVHHSIRVYYKHLAGGEVTGLPVGPANDPDGEEVETLWAPWRGGDRAQYRPHIAQAFEIFEAMAQSAAKWPDQPF